MKKALKISTILSWFNMIIWGISAGLTLLGGVLSGNMPLLIVGVLTGVIVLHSYASLQLHKSIRNPAIPLSSQTPVGLRFIGFIALFFGISFFTEGLAMLQSTRELAKLLEPQMPPQIKDMDVAKFIRTTGIFGVVTGLCVSINVFLGFRLLRWYLFLRDNDIK
ncbi:MAG: hypothetical protein ABUM51_01700 [Bacteroidota bacterium]